MIKNIHSLFPGFLYPVLVGSLCFNAHYSSANTNQEIGQHYFAGAQQLMVKDVDLDAELPLFVVYPTQERAEVLYLGPFSLKAKAAAPIASEQYPLVIISHGTGGNHIAYLSIAQFLAERGYVVAMLQHYKNHYLDNSLENTDENLIYRPRHISLAVDTLKDNSFFSSHLDEEQTAIIGHSMGGYTGLAIAGGQVSNEAKKSIETKKDQRVKALVLLAPATFWFAKPGSLKDVNIPILLFSAEHDAPLPPNWHQTYSKVVLDQVKEKYIDFRYIENSGHFSFLSPFPEVLKTPGFLPATDPEGFDRPEFHKKLNVEILSFLKRVLQDGAEK